MALTNLQADSATNNTWETALADYRAKRAVADAFDPNDLAGDEAVNVYCAAMDRLIEVIPSPNIGALATKLRLARERFEDGNIPTEWLEHIAQDADRLAMAEAPSSVWTAARAAYDTTKQAFDAGDIDDDGNALRLDAMILAELALMSLPAESWEMFAEKARLFITEEMWGLVHVGEPAKAALLADIANILGENA